jgi:hypothetical protein
LEDCHIQASTIQQVSFPNCPAIHQSLNVTHNVDDALVFGAEPNVPFEEETKDQPANGQNNCDTPRTTDDPLALPLEDGKQWAYVEDFQPAKEIASTIDTANIVQGKSFWQPLCFVTIVANPKLHYHAMKSAEAMRWKEAEHKEIANMKKHNVWIERPRLPLDQPISSTWAYRKKLRPDNQVIEYKAQICVQGFRQTSGINFDLTYAPTGKAVSLRLLLWFAVNHNLQIQQLDIESAFLTCPLEDVCEETP